MRIHAPCGLNGARGAAGVAAIDVKPPGERCRRHEIRRQLHCFEHGRLRAIPILIDKRTCPRGEQHSALTAIDSPIENPAPVIAIERFKRTAPVPACATKFQHRAAGPMWRRRGFDSLFGQRTRGGKIVAPVGFDKQAVKTEQFGVRAARHCGEHLLGSRAISRELRGLRTQQ